MSTTVSKTRSVTSAEGRNELKYRKLVGKCYLFCKNNSQSSNDINYFLCLSFHQCHSYIAQKKITNNFLVLYQIPVIILWNLHVTTCFFAGVFAKTTISRKIMKERNIEQFSGSYHLNKCRSTYLCPPDSSILVKWVILFLN